MQPKLYRSVIDDVINAVREVFLDDGVDEQVLQELKQTWEKKLGESKAIDTNAKEPEPTPKSNRSNNSNRNSNRDNSNHQTQHQQQQAQALQQQHHPPLQHHQQSQPLHQQGATSQQITAQSSQLTNAGAVNHVQTAQPTAGTIPQQAFTGLIQPSVIYTTTPAGDSVCKIMHASYTCIFSPNFYFACFVEGWTKNSNSTKVYYYSWS